MLGDAIRKHLSALYGIDRIVILANGGNREQGSADGNGHAKGEGERCWMYTVMSTTLGRRRA